MAHGWRIPSGSETIPPSVAENRLSGKNRFRRTTCRAVSGYAA